MFSWCFLSKLEVIITTAITDNSLSLPCYGRWTISTDYDYWLSRSFCSLYSTSTIELQRSPDRHFHIVYMIDHVVDPSGSIHGLVFNLKTHFHCYLLINPFTIPAKLLCTQQYRACIISGLGGMQIKIHLNLIIFNFFIFVLFLNTLYVII